MNTLREMLPPDMLQYCQHHGLLDVMLSGDSESDPSSPAPGKQRAAAALAAPASSSTLAAGGHQAADSARTG
jgi:hypothetical protein